MMSLYQFRNGFKAVLIIALLFISINPLFAQGNDASHSSLVVLKAEGLSTNLNKIASGINKDMAFTLEYSCVESNVVVIKCKHTFSSKGDVQQFVKSQFKKWTGNDKVEFIYLDVVAGSSTKC